MQYCYNYGFLKKFMEDNRLQKKDILEALGSSDYVSVNRWLDGKVAVHITGILRLCNYYNIPLASFFVDEDGMPVDVTPALPDADAQVLPTDGYGMGEGPGYGIIETRVYDRKIGSPRQALAVNKGLIRQARQQLQRDAALNGASQNEVAPELSAPISADKGTNEVLLKIELDHCKEMQRIEYDRLMTIIRTQQQEIQRLRATSQGEIEEPYIK